MILSVIEVKILETKSDRYLIIKLEKMIDLLKSGHKTRLFCHCYISVKEH